MRRSTLPVAAALAVAGVALAFGPVFAREPKAPKAAKAPAQHVVKIVGMKFVPDTLVVKPGDEVVWKNEDIVPHNVFGSGIASPLMNPGGSYTWKAPEQKGNYSYLCSLHTMMKGAVQVK